MAVVPTFRADQLKLGAEFQDGSGHDLELVALAGGLSGGAGSSPTVNQAFAFNFTDLTATLGGTLDVSGETVTGLVTPTQDSHAANKAYVDSVANGLDVKLSCRASTTAVLADAYTLSGIDTLTADANGAFPAQDGITLIQDESILIKDETAANEKNNGIYTLTQVGDGSNPWILVRRDDADTDAKVTAGMFTFVTEGTVNDNVGFVLTTNDPITVGTTALAFSEFSGAGSITAGAGMTKTGSTLNVIATDTSITVATDDLGVNLRTSSGLAISSGVGIELDTGGTPGLALSANGLTVDLDGTSLALAASGLSLATNGVAPGNLAMRDQVGDLSSDGDFSFAAGVSTAAIGATPLVDANIRFQATLFDNGANVRTQVTGTPSADNEWQIDGSNLVIFGNVTSLGTTFRLHYKTLQP